MSRNIGEVRVSVLPDGTRFKPEATADLKKAVANMRATIPLVASSDRFKLEAEKAAREAGSFKATIKIDGDARPLDAKLAELAARSEAFKKSLGNIKVSDPNMQAFLRGISNQVDDLRKNLDKIDGNGIDKANASLNRMISSSDKVRSALGKTTFAEEEVANAAREASAKIDHEAAKQASSFNKVTQSAKRFAQEISKQGINDNVKIKVKLDETMSDVQMADLRIKLDHMKGTAKVGLDDGDAEAKALTLREKLKAFFAKNIKQKVDLDNNSIKGFLGKLIGLRTAAELEGAKGGKGFGNGFAGGLAKSALMQNPGITALVVAGLAALPAALGVIGVLGGIALGAGIVFAAEKLITSQLKNINTISKTQLAVNTDQATIARLSNTKKLTAAQQQQLAVAKQKLTVDKQSLALAQNNSAGISQKQLLAYQASFNNLNNAISRAKASFLVFALIASKPLLKPFTDAVDYLSKQLRGPLAVSFRNLFTAVGPLVKPVLQSFLEIVQGILPGMTALLTKARGPLTNLFLAFGKIVGLRLGQWFKDAIPYIQVSAIYFNKLINALGIAGSYLIKFGGESAKAFTNPALKGFGPLIERIANDLIKLVKPAFDGWVSVMAPVTKALLKILVPILDFLARNPALVKAITAAVAAFLLFNKVKGVIAGVQLALKGLGTGGVWGLVVAAAVLAVVEIIDHWKQITNFFKKFWPWMLGAATGSIGLLVVLIVKHWSQIAGETARIWGGIVKFFKNLWASISHETGVAWNGIFGFLKSTWGHIENTVTGVFKPIASVVSGIWNEIYKITKNIWHADYVVIRDVVLVIVGIVGEAWRGIKNLTGEIWPWVYNTTKNIWGHVENVVTGVAKTLGNYVRDAWNGIKGVTGAVWNWIFSASKNIWGHIENVVTSIAKSLGNYVRDVWDGIKRVTGDVWNAIFGVLKNIWGKIWSAVTSTASRMAANLHNTWNTISGWTRAGWNVIHDYIVNPLSKAWNWVQNNFVRGVKGAFSGLVSAVRSIWNGLKKVVADPINFVGGLWNKFAGFVNKGLSIFGIKQKLPQAPTLRFARGGHVPGYAPGQDTVHAMLSPGEYVINPVAARKIGKSRLDALNSVAHGPAGPGKPGHYASGGDVLADAEKWRGHKYVWGGGSNPSTGWDCSSFVSYIVGHDFNLNLPGGGSWATETANGRAHGPVAAQYNNWNYGRRVPWTDAKKADLAVENNGGHITFVAQDNTSHSGSAGLQAFGAVGRAFGTTFQEIYPNAFHLIRFADDRGFLSQVGGALGSVLTPLAQAALSGVEGIINAGMNHIPFANTPIAKMAKASVDDVLNAAKKALTNNSSNYMFLGPTAFGPDGVGTSGSEMQNGLQLYQYLRDNLFAGNKIAAAGAAASIWGESAWNPFAQGTGGRGLIGWTPPSTISDAAFRGGMATQLPEIIRFVSKNGDQGAIAEMEVAKSVLAAANIWGKRVERYGINDVHSTGLALASSFMNMGGSGAKSHPAVGASSRNPLLHRANGGPVPTHVFDRGGTLAPGINTVYNLTGKPEHVRPVNGHDSQHVTLEIKGGDSDTERFLLAMIRRFVRVKGAGSVQKAFGRHG